MKRVTQFVWGVMVLYIPSWNLNHKKANSIQLSWLSFIYTFVESKFDQFGFILHVAQTFYIYLREI